MRVILPQDLKHQKARRHKRSLQIIFAFFIIGLLTFGTIYYLTSTNTKYSEKIEDISTPVFEKQKVFRTFSGQEFKNLYDNFRYANTDKIIIPPEITGNAAADSKIRSLAEARGYRLRRLARDVLGDADGKPIQALAAKPWQDLKARAAQDGIILTVTWAFRSVEDQRAIFLEALQTQGVSAEDIAAGQVDNLVDKVLQTYAPPGYSRHHTGFTIDLTCGTEGLTNFRQTACYEWLSRDNYINAKTFGWVPSYPEGASLQGPEPEPWEYIWVTVDALLE